MILCDTNVIIEALKNNPVVIAAMEKIGLERIAVSKDFIYIEKISLWSR